MTRPPLAGDVAMLRLGLASDGPEPALLVRRETGPHPRDPDGLEAWWCYFPTSPGRLYLRAVRRVTV